MRGKHFLIDCGEGAQLALRRAKLGFNRLRAIFISHMHGDHVFGLPGLLSTFAMLGRTADVHLYGPKGLKRFVANIESQFIMDKLFSIEVHELDHTRSELVYQDPSIMAYTLPLKHRIPTVGYLFRERDRGLHLDKASCDFYQVPIAAYAGILAGEDYTTSDGTTVPYQRLTTPGTPPRSYAYCSDTAYHPPLAELIRGVDLLYHEATFADSEIARTTHTGHSTARQAGTLAYQAAVKRLLIGHFSSRYDSVAHLLEEARQEFPETILAVEGETITIE